MIPIAKRILKKLGYVHISEIRKQLNFAHSIGKRLDEHREIVEAIEEYTSLFCDRPWHIGHMAVQDDYLMRLYRSVHGRWPVEQARAEGFQSSSEHVRTRPAILGQCGLVEFQANQSSAAQLCKEVAL